MQVVSASRHAVERYNEVFPGSPPAAVLAAVQLALPMPKALAHALAGRPAAAARPDQDSAEHRLDPTGTGIFVVVPLAHEPGQGFVRTFLRLASSTQREMARRWFLGPLPALTRAFELGWEAAQRGDQPSAALAAAAQRDELLELAPTFGGTFPDDSLEEDTADPHDGPGRGRRDSAWETSDLDATDDPPTLEIDAASAPPEARPTEPEDDLVARSSTWLIVDAAQLRPTGWSGRALRDAARESIAQVPVEWLTGYDPVDPDALRAFARARRWNLRPERIYAARQHRGALFLIAASVSRDSGLVDRCARVRPGDGLTES